MTPSSSSPKHTAQASGESLLLLANQLCFPIYAAGHLIQKLYRPLLEPLGLTYPQYLVMLVLWEEEGLTVSELGERLLLDTGTLSPLLKRLETQQLVLKKADREDARRVLVHLSSRGKTLRLQAAKVPELLLCKVLEQTGPRLAQELGGLRDQLKQLVQALSQETP